MIALLEAVEASGPAAFLRASFIAYPLVNAAHILAIGVLVTCAVLMDLRLLGMGQGVAAGTVVDHLRPITIGAVAFVLVTGGLLFSVRPLEYAANPAFQIKMALLALALLNALYFTLRRSHERVQGLGARAMLAASIVLWPAVLVAGRFIGFLE